MFIAVNQVPESNFVAVGETEEEASRKMSAFLDKKGFVGKDNGENLEEYRGFVVGHLSEDGTIDLDNVSELKKLPPGTVRGSLVASTFR